VPSICGATRTIRYASAYRAFVAEVEAAERERAPGMSELAEAVARNLAKLMAYKDEYEVARLYSDGAFRERLAAQFEGAYRLELLLAPPLLARIDPQTGEPREASLRRMDLPGAGMARQAQAVARVRPSIRSGTPASASSSAG